MPRLENEELVRVHLHIFKSDLDDLRMLFENNMGYNKATRHIIRRFLNAVRAKAGGKPIGDIHIKELEL